MRTPWMVHGVPSLVDANLNDQRARRDRARDQCSEFGDESRNGAACSIDACWVSHLILLDSGPTRWADNRPLFEEIYPERSRRRSELTPERGDRAAEEQNLQQVFRNAILFAGKAAGFPESVFCAIHRSFSE
jgi:hypothetical protein